MIAIWIFFNFLFVGKPAYTNTVMHLINAPVDECDTITRKDFFLNTSKGIECMKSVDSLSDQQAIMLIRLYNTLHIDSVAKTKHEIWLCSNFKKVFDERFILTHPFRELGMGIGKGFSLVSVKYNLAIGNSGTLRCRDIFILLD